MKSLLFTYLFIFHLLGFSQEDVNYHHKKIERFIKKTYKLDSLKIKEVNSEELSVIFGKFFHINETFYVYVGRVNSCRAGGCSIEHTSENGNFEYFDYVIAFDQNKKVKKVKVYNYQATHGHEVTAKSWLKQFIDADINKTLKVNKNIDAISGATISVHSLTDDVNLVIKNLELL